MTGRDLLTPILVAEILFYYRWTRLILLITMVAPIRFHVPYNPPLSHYQIYEPITVLLHSPYSRDQKPYFSPYLCFAFQLPCFCAVSCLCHLVPAIAKVPSAEKAGSTEKYSHKDTKSVLAVRGLSERTLRRIQGSFVKKRTGSENRRLTNTVLVVLVHTASPFPMRAYRLGEWESLNQF